MTDIAVEVIQNEKDHLRKAELIDAYRKKNDLTITVLSKKLKINASYVCHYLRLLKLPPIVVDGYYGKMVSATHLYIIARLKDQSSMQQAYEQVLAQSLTSQQTEALIRELLYGVASDDNRLTQDEIKEYLKLFKTKYPDFRVSIVQTRIQAKLVCEIKGDTAQTSKYLVRLLNKIVGELPEQKKKLRKEIIEK